MTDYHIQMFPQENQNAWDALLAEYKKLFEEVKYKDANAKLDEVNVGIMAFIQGNTIEVADNNIEGVSESNDSANNDSGNSNAGNTNNGNANADGGSGNGGNSGNGGLGGESGNGGNEGSGNSNTSVQPEESEPAGTGWSQAEWEIMNEINMNWSDFIYTDAEAQAQLSSRLPGRNCTLVHYSPEQNAEAKAFWNSLDKNAYEKTNLLSDDVYGSYFIYGK